MSLEEKTESDPNERPRREYKTFAEIFIEEPPIKYRGEEKIYRLSPSIPVPVPTFSSLMKVWLTDDADWLE